MTNKEGSILFQKGNPYLPGAVHINGGINFCASFREPGKAVLHLLDSKGRTKYRIPMQEGQSAGACLAVFVPRIGKTPVSYRYTCNGKPVRDPYARVVTGDGVCRTVKEEIRVAKPAAYERPEDMILYKLHVKGYTKNDPSVPAEMRGTFAGLARKIPYLTELGINTVELMPCYAFDPVLPNGKKNYWGYAADNQYFAPNPAYVSGSDPAEEMRGLVDALHGAGIRCIMEIYIPDHSPISIPCEALRYWSLQYGVDGFHLNGKYSVIEEILQDPYLADRILLLDSAAQAISDYQTYASQDHVYAYHHDFRKNARLFLKGEGGVAAAFAEECRSCPAQYHVVNYISDHNGFTLMDAVSYNEKHNEANGEGNQDGPPDTESWNCGEEGPTKKKEIRLLRKKQIRNALAYVFLAQGIPMLYAGDEFGNSQKGNSNGYCLDNATGWLDWKDAEKHKDLTDYVKMLIRFRKEHTILHTGVPLRGSDYNGTGLPDLSFHGKSLFGLEPYGRAFSVLLNGKYAKKEEPFLFVAMNADCEPYRFALPTLPEGYRWEDAFSTEYLVKEEEPEADGNRYFLKLAPRSVRVLTGEKQCRS